MLRISQLTSAPHSHTQIEWNVINALHISVILYFIFVFDSKLHPRRTLILSVWSSDFTDLDKDVRFISGEFKFSFEFYSNSWIL